MDNVVSLYLGLFLRETSAVQYENMHFPRKPLHMIGALKKTYLPEY